MALVDELETQLAASQATAEHFLSALVAEFTAASSLHQYRPPKCILLNWAIKDAVSVSASKVRSHAFVLVSQQVIMPRVLRDSGRCLPTTGEM